MFTRLSNVVSKPISRWARFVVLVTAAAALSPDAFASTGLFGCTVQSNTCVSSGCKTVTASDGKPACVCTAGTTNAPAGCIIDSASDCWSRQKTYQCYTGTQTNTCTASEIGGCNLINSTCQAATANGACVDYSQTWACPDKATQTCTPSGQPGSNCNLYDKQCNNQLYGVCVDETDNYACTKPTTPCNTDSACTETSSKCISTMNGACATEEQNYTCSKTTKTCTQTGYQSSCSGVVTDGYENQVGQKSNPDALNKAMQAMAIMDEIKKSISNSMPPKIFSGEELECHNEMFCGSFLSACCCGLDVKATDKGLLNQCTADEGKLAGERRKDLTHYLTSGCNHAVSVFGSCLFCSVKAQWYCGFPSMLARLIQEQGRQQLASLAAKGYAGATQKAITFNFYADGSNGSTASASGTTSTSTSSTSPVAGGSTWTLAQPVPGVSLPNTTVGPQPYQGSVAIQNTPTIQSGMYYHLGDGDVASFPIRAADTSTLNTITVAYTSTNPTVHTIWVSGVPGDPTPISSACIGSGYQSAGIRYVTPAYLTANNLTESSLPSTICYLNPNLVYYLNVKNANQTDLTGSTCPSNNCPFVPSFYGQPLDMTAPTDPAFGGTGSTAITSTSGVAGWNGPVNVNGNDVWYYRWPSACNSTTTAAPTSDTCPTDLNSWFAVCDGANCSTPPSAPPPGNAPQGMTEGQATYGSTGPFTLSRYVVADGGCDDTGSCKFTLSAWPGANGGTAMLRMPVSWNYYSSKAGWNNPVSLGDSYVFKGYSESFDTRGQAVTSVQLEYSVDKGHSFSTVTLPLNLPASDNYVIPGTQITVFGSCPGPYYGCKYYVTAPARAEAKPWILSTSSNDCGIDDVKADCSGFTIGQFMLLDLNKMDLSEWLSTIKPKVPDQTSMTTAAANQSSAMQASDTSALPQTDNSNAVVVRLNRASCQQAGTTDECNITLTATSNWDQTYTDSSLNNNPVSNITVTWGDGSQNAVYSTQVVNGLPLFSASHHYQGVGTYPINVTFNMPDGTSHHAKVQEIVWDNDPPASNQLDSGKGGSDMVNSPQPPSAQSDPIYPGAQINTSPTVSSSHFDTSNPNEQHPMDLGEYEIASFEFKVIMPTSGSIAAAYTTYHPVTKTVWISTSPGGRPIQDTCVQDGYETAALNWNADTTDQYYKFAQCQLQNGSTYYFNVRNVAKANLMDPTATTCDWNGAQSDCPFFVSQPAPYGLEYINFPV